MHVLQFSGGRDSLACLYLLEPRWEQITVAWCNPGMAFPETLAQMEQIRQTVPHFLEIHSHQSIETQGYPVDILPIASTALGQHCEGHRGLMFQSRYDCCKSALWEPTQAAMKQMGATRIIRGEKYCDPKKSGLPNWAVVEGVTYEFPLYDWTDVEVASYLHDRGIELPANYRYMDTGLDCWNCSAYLDENSGKMRYMQQFHPEKYMVVKGVLQELLEATHKGSFMLEEALK
jgi:phosphoadenosine phosphosulfate reductase